MVKLGGGWVVVVGVRVETHGRLTMHITSAPYEVCLGTRCNPPSTIRIFSSSVRSHTSPPPHVLQATARVGVAQTKDPIIRLCVPSVGSQKATCTAADDESALKRRVRQEDQMP